ncbi:protein disulfide oxidoreductase [Orenia marismortui]|uniref:Glutaredoxin-like protein n=1 Tax=Orenia marismortui TaxID=46469 RepID=A0A4R8HBH1_9FIRM|nr:thioredoxin family protein [Orenia marismortui]TDX53179.1 glutaredoxin-like protein [Orenia marismortui]
MFNNKVKIELRDYLGWLEKEVNIIYFKDDSELCSEATEFLKEISELSDKIDLKIYNIKANKSRAERYEIDKVPAIIILDEDNKESGIKFYGAPIAYEINSFISCLLEVSGKKEALNFNLSQRIDLIDHKVHLEIFVSLDCIYCSKTLISAQRLALENDNITADMIDVNAFPNLAAKNNVRSIPKLIINGEESFVGAKTESDILDEIERLLFALRR